MGSLLNFLELVALVTWLGAILFFSSVAAPTIFRALEPAEAGKAVRAMFPRYYLIGIACGLVLTAVQIGRGLLWYWGGMIRPALALFALLTLVNLYARQVLMPAINRAREAGPSDKVRFDRLHRRSVALNIVVLLAGLLYLVWMAARGY